VTSVFTEPSTARVEAERLVAAALAFASLAAESHPELATGSAACCVCPLCKLIEAIRDPDPQFVERLATGAGDLAVGVASLLRNLSGTRETADADPWRSATAPEPAEEAPATRTTKKKMAKKAIAKKAVAPRKTSGEKPAEQEELPPEKAAPKKAAKKALPRPRPESGG
jgi:hypothetical protein